MDEELAQLEKRYGLLSEITINCIKPENSNRERFI